MPMSYSLVSAYTFSTTFPLFDLTTFETLFLCKCQLELENSSPETDRPPLAYVEESSCWRFVKTVRVLAEIFKTSMLPETSRQSIIQVLMNPILPPERNTDAMNLFLSSIGKLADFQFCDENLKQLVQSSRAAEFESRCNEEVRLRKEAEDALARKKDELELMKRLLKSYKEEEDTLHSQAQALETKHQEELRRRRETEYALAVERERIAKVTLGLETLENERDDMCLKAEELESKYKGELILRKETETALHKERKELEEMEQQLETFKTEQENLNSQVITWQDKYEQESRLRKETEDGASRELGIVKGLLENYGREADAKREERDNALKLVQELTRKQAEERQPLESFICPITQEVMKDPHLTADGHSYEAEAIRTWFSTGRVTSPMTNVRLPHCNLVPNRTLRSAIRELLEKHNSSI